MLFMENVYVRVVNWSRCQTDKHSALWTSLVLSPGPCALGDRHARLRGFVRQEILPCFYFLGSLPKLNIFSSCLFVGLFLVQLLCFPFVSLLYYWFI